MKKIIELVLFILVFVFLGSNLALADGAIVPPRGDYNVTEAEQKAIIFYDQGKEDLILSITFKSDATDFGWLIPVPQKPTVDKSSDKAFEKLGELTRPKENLLEKIESWSFISGRKGVYGEVPLSAGLGAKETVPQPVTVLETKEVGIFEITILSATDSKNLSEWLDKNNYNFPPGADLLLKDYIANNWYFVAVKINPSLLPFLNSSEEKLNLKTGHATPLKISFQTDKLIYPLKISSLNESNPSSINKKNNKEIFPYYEVSILLYVFTDHKKIPANYSLTEENKKGSFTINYADQIGAQAIEEMAVTETGDPWIKPNHDFYLTKLSSHIKPADMTEDLFFKNASDDYSVNAGHLRWYQWFLVPFWAIFYGVIINPLAWVILVILFFILSIPQFLLKSRFVWMICWIFQFSALFLATGLFLLITTGFLFSMSGGLSAFFSVLIGWFLFFLVTATMYLIVILQFRKHHKLLKEKNK